MNVSKKDGGLVTFGDKKGKIIGKSIISNDSFTFIENVLLVDGLKHDLLSLSKLCDKGFRVVFDKNNCIIENASDRKVLLVGNRDDNVYTIDLYYCPTNDKCLSVLLDNSWLWHRRLGHTSMHLISNISKNSLLRGLPQFKFEKDKICDACQMGKQAKSSFKSKNVISTTRPLQLLHMDLFGPSKIASYGGNYYARVIVDFSRFTWVLMINDVLKRFASFVKRVQNEKGFLITKIRSDHGEESDSIAFENFVKIMVFLMTSHVQGLLNKTVWLKRKILLYKNLLDQC